VPRLRHRRLKSERAARRSFFESQGTIRLFASAADEAACAWPEIYLEPRTGRHYGTFEFPCFWLDRSANGWSPCVLPHICATIEQTKLLWEGPHRADRHLEKALTKRRSFLLGCSEKLQRWRRALLLRIESP
jgi:hypothetical protein